MFDNNVIFDFGVSFKNMYNKYQSDYIVLQELETVCM